jgi:hypothetical protein
MTVEKARKYFSPLVFVCFLAIIIYQAQYNWRTYVKPWLKDNKGFIYVSSPQRSALLTMGPERAAYMRFLDAYLPEDAAIVIPGDTTWFSSQSIVQNFLFPRAILACCGSDDVLCRSCLDNQENYILAIDSFPLPEEQPGRVFIPYPEGTNSLRGVYVPYGMVNSLPMPDRMAYLKTTPVSVQALVMDILILGCFFIIGFLVLSLIDFQRNWGDIVELSIPLAMGLFSWGLFLLSYLGFPLSLGTVMFLFLVYLSFTLGAYYFIRKSIPGFPRFMGFADNNPSYFSRIVFIVLLAFLTAVFGLVIFIAIGRGYSMFDDIVNWSFKGYAMVDSGTIWAAGRWGGHVLAYPMNLALSIGVFRLADGDVIPGSKFLYLALVFSLLFGCYRFLARNSTPRILALASVTALLLVPLFFMHATIGFANLPFTSYLVLGVLYSLEAVRSLKLSQGMLGGLLLALSAWTRPEGIMFGFAFLALIFFLAFFVLKTRMSLALAAALILPMVVIPGVWMILLGSQGMAEDQIGLALDVVLNNLVLGSLYNEHISTLAGYAIKTFYAGPFMFLLFSAAVIILSAPLTKWYMNRFKLSLFILDVLAFILPGFMFFIASFSEKDYAAFLDQSFDRAYLPALTITILVAALALSHRSPILQENP